ncbi:MAG: hypothetical protein K2X87_11750 [Gemmataceae bacterium]|nr:hypothetical protein [Gemmataceae bacterium]
MIVARTLVGLLFVWAGAAYFGKLMEQSAPPFEVGSALHHFDAAFTPTGYMDAVKVVELVGGLLLLSGRLTPLGVVVLMPVAVNIALFDLLLVRQFGFGVVLVVLLAFVAVGYRRYFAPFFVPDARIG